MSRRMSFAMTPRQFVARTKTVTRRDGWRFAKPGDVYTGVEKCQGLRKGERQVVFHDLRVLSVRRERLGDITIFDVAREGFPGETPAQFIARYGKPPDHTVTRIEFEHLPVHAPSPIEEPK